MTSHFHRHSVHGHRAEEEEEYKGDKKDATVESTDAGTPRTKELDGVELRVGDKVEYHPVEGSLQTTVGTITAIYVKDFEMGGRVIHASRDEPRFVIKNDHTKKETAYYKKAIERKLEEEETEE
ncbi:hypothetical protein HK104_002535 [Borealophlyctis nickersoniae]|nr:hypothetical protein HK104_002535 [Borealophlyctis nickersoniae]